MAKVYERRHDGPTDFLGGRRALIVGTAPEGPDGLPRVVGAEGPEGIERGKARRDRAGLAGIAGPRPAGGADR